MSNARMLTPHLPLLFFSLPRPSLSSLLSLPALPILLVSPTEMKFGAASLVLLAASAAARSPSPPVTRLSVGPNGDSVLLSPVGLLVTSLQYGTTPTDGALVPGGVGAEVTQALTNVAAIFASAGLDLSASASSCWMYLKSDIVDSGFDDASDAYKAFFKNATHPTRSPTGVGFSLEGASAAVECHGFRDDKAAVSIPGFFETDFNSQGVLLKDDLLLYTSGQIAFDPASETLVEGGIGAETSQVLSNLDVVFSAAFPNGGSLSQNAAECQVLVRGDDSDLSTVKSLFSTFFESRLPALSYTFGDPGAGASVEAACLGFSPSPTRRALPIDPKGLPLGAGLLLKDAAGPDLLYTSLLRGVLAKTVRQEVDGAVAAVSRVFEEAFPSLGASALPQAAAYCNLVVSDGKFAQEANEALDDVFEEENVKPARSTIVAGIEGGARVALRCWGAR